MPSATRSGPIVPSSGNSQMPPSESQVVETGGYNTRGKLYKYSNTKPPYVPPPPRPTKRPPPPVSAALKKRRLNTNSSDAHGSANMDANTANSPEPRANESTSESSGEIITTQSNMDSLGVADQPTNYSNTDGNPSLTTPSGHLHNSVPVGLSNLGVGGCESETTNPSGGSGEQPVLTGLQLSGSQPHKTSGSNYTESRVPVLQDLAHNLGSSTSTFSFTTPTRPTRSAGFPTPAVLIFGTPAPWARFDTEQESSFQTIPVTTIQSFNRPSARIEDIDPNAPFTQCSTSNDYPRLSNTQSASNDNLNATGDTGYTSNASDTQIVRFDPNVNSRSNPSDSHTTPATQFQHPPASATSSSTTDFLNLYNAIQRTLPPPPTRNYPAPSTSVVRLPNPPTTQISVAAAPSTISHSSSVSPISGPHSRTDSVTRAASLAIDDWNSRGGSTNRASPAPSTFTTLPSTFQPQRSLRQSDFLYDQVIFMNTMAKRWHWYLIADDTFPINTAQALELCVQYAEQHLEVSRVGFNLTRASLDFVRKKESGIRNLFQTNLLAIVEDGYGVNPGETQRLNELICQSNYIYAEYDIETKKVIGRYRHPCLMRVLNAILFTKRTRGRAIGVCFMPELMQEGSSIGAPNQPASAGISVSMIALACTLVLYALQSIKAGDSSQRVSSRKGKPLHFTEKKYSGPYRSFVSKLQQYGRLDELRKTYMEEIMKEYLKVYTDNHEDSDVDIEVDDGMHSDGD